MALTVVVCAVAFLLMLDDCFLFLKSSQMFKLKEPSSARKQ
jgi:hypothetical protein